MRPDKCSESSDPAKANYCGSIARSNTTRDNTLKIVLLFLEWRKKNKLLILNPIMWPVSAARAYQNFPTQSAHPAWCMHNFGSWSSVLPVLTMQSTRECRIFRIKYANCNQKDSFDIAHRFYIMLKNRRPISAPPLTVGSTSSHRTSSPPWRKSSKRTRRTITSKGDNPVCRSFVKRD